MNDPRPATGGMEAMRHTIELTSLRFKQKLDAMRIYAASAGGILQEEVKDAFHTYGEQAFTREYLFAAAAQGQEPERRFSRYRNPFMRPTVKKRLQLAVINLSFISANMFCQL